MQVEDHVWVTLICIGAPHDSVAVFAHPNQYEQQNADRQRLQHSEQGAVGGAAVMRQHYTTTALHDEEAGRQWRSVDALLVTQRQRTVMHCRTVCVALLSYEGEPSDHLLRRGDLHHGCN